MNGHACVVNSVSAYRHIAHMHHASARTTAAHAPWQRGNPPAMSLNINSGSLPLSFTTEIIF
jgi:hypothetical protein